MPNPRLATRYAKSLIDLAVETDQLEVVFRDMEFLYKACRGSRELESFIKSPVINADKKIKIFHILFKDKLGELSWRFCDLLIKKGRESYLPEIAQAAIRQYRVIKHIRQVKITTAVAMDESLKNEIIDKVKSEIPDQQIELLTSVKEELVGGFLLETDNSVFDASIRRDLRDIKKQFNINVYVRSIR